MKEISVVIPTFQRGDVLLQTIEKLWQQEPVPNEIIVVDQTEEHPLRVRDRLELLNENGMIFWVRLEQPSITYAMNIGLEIAKSDVVLFLDDDIEPVPGLTAAHLRVFIDDSIWASTGQVLQPGQLPADVEPGSYPGPGLWHDLNFPFNGIRSRQTYNCMAGNLAVRREQALAVGGLDMNFQGVAHRFETEFARRLTDAGGIVMFNPAATIRHLQAPSGGTRSFGSHLTSAEPSHSTGDYYLAFMGASGATRWRFIAGRFFRSVRTRFHFRHPWWIPVKLWGEVRGLFCAYRLSKEGPKYWGSEHARDATK